MAIDLNNFLHSLVRYISTRASLPYKGTGRALYVHRLVDEAAAAAVKTALVVYPGPGTVWDGLPVVAVQVETIGVANAALSQAQKVFEALSESDGRPLQGVAINGYAMATDAADGTWRLTAVHMLQRPGQVGVLDDGRARVVFNVEVYFARPAA